MIDPLYTAEEMRAAEQGHDVAVLMERAGRAVAERALERFPGRPLVHGRLQAGRERRRRPYRRRRAPRRGPRRARRRREGAGPDLGSPDVVVDAIFETGFRGAPREDAAALIQRINGLGGPVVAVDLPSGVDASTGEVAGAAVEASLTVAFHGPKVGLAVAPGRFLAGEVVVADIGLERADTRHGLVTPDILRLVPGKRARTVSTRPVRCSSWAGRRGSRAPPAWPRRRRSGPTRATSWWRRRRRSRCSRHACWRR